MNMPAERRQEHKKNKLVFEVWVCFENLLVCFKESVKQENKSAKLCETELQNTGIYLFLVDHVMSPHLHYFNKQSISQGQWFPKCGLWPSGVLLRYCREKEAVYKKIRTSLFSIQWINDLKILHCI